MTPASFAQAVVDYAQFLAQKNDYPLLHSQLEEIRHIAYGAFSVAEARWGRPKIDGLDAVSWIKKYRNEFGTTLKAAKDEWDKRLAAQTTPRPE